MVLANVALKGIDSNFRPDFDPSDYSIQLNKSGAKLAVPLYQLVGQIQQPDFFPGRFQLEDLEVDEWSVSAKGGILEYLFVIPKPGEEFSLYSKRVLSQAKIVESLNPNSVIGLQALTREASGDFYWSERYSASELRSLTIGACDLVALLIHRTAEPIPLLDLLEEQNTRVLNSAVPAINRLVSAHRCSRLNNMDRNNPYYEDQMLELHRERLRRLEEFSRDHSSYLDPLFKTLFAESIVSLGRQAVDLESVLSERLFRGFVSQGLPNFSLELMGLTEDGFNLVFSEEALDFEGLNLRDRMQDLARLVAEAEVLGETSLATKFQTNYRKLSEESYDERVFDYFVSVTALELAVQGLERGLEVESKFDLTQAVSLAFRYSNGLKNRSVVFLVSSEKRTLDLIAGALAQMLSASVLRLPEVEVTSAGAVLTSSWWKRKLSLLETQGESLIICAEPRQVEALYSLKRMLSESPLSVISSAFVSVDSSDQLSALGTQPVLEEVLYLEDSLPHLELGLLVARELRPSR